MCDYFTRECATDTLRWRDVDVWDYRAFYGDHVDFKQSKKMHDMVCIFPVLDANYNEFRNWTPKLLEDLVCRYRDADGGGCQVYICCSAAARRQMREVRGVTIVTDLAKNLELASSCSIFVGGDTGFAHLVGAIKNCSRKRHFVYSRKQAFQMLPLGYCPERDELELFLNPEARVSKRQQIARYLARNYKKALRYLAGADRWRNSPTNIRDCISLL